MITLQGSEEWTVSVWSYRDRDYTDYCCILANDGYTYTLQTRDGGYSDKIGCRINSHGYTIASNTSHPWDWTHIALVNDTSNISLYINGILNSTISSRSTQFNYIGHRSYNQVSLIDDLCIVKDAVWTEDFIPPDKYLYDYLNPKGSYILSNLKTDSN